MAVAPADRRWLDAAARIAMPYRGTTAENPTVGALVVSPEGRLLGRAVTAAGGRPHAEPAALAQAGPAARGASLYVTLEPCAHWGRTPPCVDAVLASGIGRVIIGMTDPDPRTGGGSIAKLRAAGVDVAVADDHAPSRHLHEGFGSRILRGRPFVVAKLAVSRDGMIGRVGQGNVPITGQTARRWTHMQRALSDAVVIGSATARLDRPRLDVRLPGLAGRRPLRAVIAGGPVPPDWQELWLAETGQISMVVAPPQDEAVAGLVAVAARDGRPDLGAALAALALHGVGCGLVEGGAVLTEALLAGGLVDRMHVLRSDLRIGDEGIPATARGAIEERLAQAGLVEVDRARLGCDSLTTFEKG